MDAVTTLKRCGKVTTTHQMSFDFSFQDDPYFLRMRSNGEINCCQFIEKKYLFKTTYINAHNLFAHCLCT